MDILKQRLRHTRLEWFARHAKPDLVWNWHHRVICTRLDRWIRTPGDRLVIVLPPRHSASTLASTLLPAHLPSDSAVVVVSSTGVLGMRREIDRPRMFGRDFPHIFDVAILDSVQACGCTHVIMDILSLRKSMDSCSHRRFSDWFQELANARLLAGGRALVVGQRSHQEDLASKLIGAGWDCLHFPAFGPAVTPRTLSGLAAEEQGLQECLDTLAAAGDEEGMLAVEAVYADWLEEQNRAFPDRPCPDRRGPGDPLWPGWLPQLRLANIPQEFDSVWQGSPS